MSLQMSNFKLWKSKYIKCNPTNIYLFKITTEALEKVVKYVQSKQEKQQNDVNDVVLVFLLVTLNIFHTFF